MSDRSLIKRILPEKEARQFSPLTLAFLGDSVYELWIRSAITMQGSTPVKNLHGRKIRLVCAFYQARAAERLMLTEQEQAIFQRGRNAVGNSIPKNASAADYRKATGLEAVCGYLQLCGRTERLDELMTAVWNMQEEILQMEENKE